MRDQIQKCYCGKPGMDLSLAPFDRDEKVIEAEHILSLLIESRFGPGSTYLHLEDRCATRSMADTVIFDLVPLWPFPFIAEAQFTDLTVEQERGQSTGRLRLISCSTSTGGPASRPPTTLARGQPSTVCIEKNTF